MRVYRTLLFFAMLSLNVAGATHISGSINETILANTASPYIVDADIVIPAGKVVTINPGCVLLFRPFAGIKIEGTLIVEGSSDKPVVFTSINDADFNDKSEMLPNSFDWNGIIIESTGAGSSFANFQLKYSVYGIKSQTTDISVENGVFHQNGQYHFTLNDKIQNVVDNIPFSYSLSARATINQSPDNIAATPAPVPGKQTKKPSKRRTILRISLGVVAAAGLGVGIYALNRTFYWNSEVNGVSAIAIQKNPSPQDVALYTAKGEAAKLEGKYIGSPYQCYLRKAEDERQKYKVTTIISMTCGTLSLTGLGLTFLF
jgi:hypothetical protein